MKKVWTIVTIMSFTIAIILLALAFFFHWVILKDVISLNVITIFNAIVRLLPNLFLHILNFRKSNLWAQPVKIANAEKATENAFNRGTSLVKSANNLAQEGGTLGSNVQPAVRTANDEVGRISRRNEENRKRKRTLIEKYINNEYANYLRDALFAEISNQDPSKYDTTHIENIHGHLRINHQKGLKEVFANLKVEEKIYNPEAFMYMQQRNMEYLSQMLEERGNKELLDSSKSYIILGNSGAGKSFYLKYLAYQEAKNAQSNVLPVYIQPWRWIANNKKKVLELATLELHSILMQKHRNWQVDQDSVRDYIRDKYENEEIFFLLDDFDEFLFIQSPDAWRILYNDLITDIKNLMNNSIRIIIAAHHFEREIMLGKWILEDLLRADTHSLVENAKDYLESGKQIAIKNLLNHDVRFQTLASNSINLLLIDQFSTYNNTNQKFQLNRIELYEHIIKRFFQRKDKPDQSTTPRTQIFHNIFRQEEHVQQETHVDQAAASANFTSLEKDMRRVLEKLAWHMHKEHLWMFNEIEMQRVLDQSGIDRRNKAALKIYKFNLIVPTKNGITTTYKFLNLPLQEYFAACYLLNHGTEDEVTELLKKYADPWWKEVILIYLYLHSKLPTNVQNTTSLRTGTPIGAHINDQNTVNPHQIIMNTWMPVSELQNNLDIFQRYERISSIIMAGQWLVTTHMQEPQRPELANKIMLNLLYHLATEKSLYARIRIARTIAALNQTIHNKQFMSKRILATLNRELTKLQEGGYFLRIDDIEQWINSIPTAEDVCPLHLPYLSSIDVRPEALLNVSPPSNGRLEPLLTNTHLQTELLLSSWEMEKERERIEHNLSRALLANVQNNQINTVIRADMAKALGMLGDIDQIDELFTLLRDETLPLRIRWCIIDAIGTLGDQFGFWKNENSSIKQDLLHYMTQTEDVYIILKIRLTLCTRLRYWSNTADRGHFPDGSIARLLYNVMDTFHDMKQQRQQEYRDSYKSDFQQLLEQISKKNPDKDEWVYICDIIGQLAESTDTDIIDELATFCSDQLFHEYVEMAKWRALERIA